MTMSAANRDLAPVFHLAAGLALFVGLGGAQSFGLVDLDAAGGISLPLFMALVLVVGQPRGRRGWLAAAATVLLAGAVMGIGIPALRWLAGGETALELLVRLAAFAICFAGVVAVDAVSEPAPDGSPTNPKAWKPVTRWGVLLGLATGAAVFAAAFTLWSRWLGTDADIGTLGTVVAVLQALLAGFVAAWTVIWCRPSDRRSAVSSTLAGIAMAVLTEASILGGMAVVQSLVPDRDVFDAMMDAFVISPVLVLPAGYVVTWSLGRKPAAPIASNASSPP